MMCDKADYYSNKTVDTFREQYKAQYKYLQYSNCLLYTSFEVWFMELGILTLHGRIFHPQTQGKEERFNGSLTREFLKYESFEDFEDAKIKLDKYRDFYNTKRPHYALNLDTPAKHYHPSERAYTPDISEWEYSDEYKLRKVKESGYVTIRNQGYYLSEAFSGKTIAVKESNKGQHLINLYFRQFRICLLYTSRCV